MASLFSAACRKHRLFALVWLSCATSLASAIDWDVAQSLGPSGGTVWSILSTSTSGQLYALTDGGLYRTRDNAAHWAHLDSRFTATTFAADRVDADVIHATGTDGKLYRSDNGGDAWQEEVFGGAGGEKALSVDTLVGQRGGAVVGTSANRVYNNRGAAGYFVDFDGSHENFLGISAVATHPLDSHIYFLILGNPYDGSSVVRRVADGVMTGFPSLFMLGDNPVRIAVGPGSRLCLKYSQHAVGCTVSGADSTFQTITTADHASVGLLGFAFDPTDDTHVLGIGDGAYDIRGSTATSIFAGLTIDGTSQALVESGAFDLDYATNAKLWLGTGVLGVVTRTGTGPWQTVNTGLNAYNTWTFAIDPRGKQRMVAGFWLMNVGSWPLQVTHDAGATWSPKFGDLPYMVPKAIVFDATTAVGTAEPRIFALGALDPQGYYGANIYRSIDGGATWTTLGQGLPLGPQSLGRDIGRAMGMVLDPRSCTSPPAHGACTSGPLNTLVAVTSGDSSGSYRVVRSQDGGVTWADSSSGLPAANLTPAHAERVRPRALAVAADDHTVMYLGTDDAYAGSEGSRVQASGVYRSDDGGLTWQSRSSGLPLLDNSASSMFTVRAFAVAPDHPEEVWAEAHDPNVEGIDSVYYSANGGLNWSERSVGITGSGCYVYTLLRDARTAGLLYAGGGTDNYTPCLFRSNDAGLHWFALDASAVAGRVQEMHIDPDDTRSIVVSGANGLVVLHPAPDLIFHSGMGD